MRKAKNLVIAILPGQQTQAEKLVNEFQKIGYLLNPNTTSDFDCLYLNYKKDLIKTKISSIKNGSVDMFVFGVSAQPSVKLLMSAKLLYEDNMNIAGEAFIAVDPIVN